MANTDGVFFGPAGWSYADWRGTVYPEPLPPRFNHLAFLAGQFGTFPLAVEFRHQSWLEDEVLAFFKSSGLIWTNIDQSQVSRSLALTALVTGKGTAVKNLLQLKEILLKRQRLARDN